MHPPLFISSPPAGACTRLRACACVAGGAQPDRRCLRADGAAAARQALRHRRRRRSLQGQGHRIRQIVRRDRRTTVSDDTQDGTQIRVFDTRAWREHAGSSSHALSVSALRVTMDASMSSSGERVEVQAPREDDKTTRTMHCFALARQRSF
eukprot:4355677-Pleurochrysis_carterae.AAC.5